METPGRGHIILDLDHRRVLLERRMGHIGYKVRSFNHHGRQLRPLLQVSPRLDHQHGAGAAHSFSTPVLVSGESELLPQDPQEHSIRVDCKVDAFPIESELHSFLHDQTF